MPQNSPFQPTIMSHMIHKGLYHLTYDASIMLPRRLTVSGLFLISKGNGANQHIKSDINIAVIFGGISMGSRDGIRLLMACTV